MRIVRENIYKYSELNPSTQRRVFNRVQEQIQQDYDYDGVNESIREKLEELGFEVDHIYIDNGYSQGSGGCFTGWFRPDDVKTNKFFDIEVDLKDYKSKYKITHSERYYHENSTSIEKFDVEDEWEENIYELESGFKSDYQYLCRKLFRVAQDDYEMATSEDIVMEVINEKEFYENGMEYLD
jgi:hypothetical protein